jgi:acetyltransferase
MDLGMNVAWTTRVPLPPHQPAPHDEPRPSSAYPGHLIESVRLRDGTPLTIRPIRADDYRLELDFVRGLSARTAYQRLLSPRKLRADELLRMVRIDYSRELALIATAVVDGRLRQVGVARYAPEPDGASCDFGIVIADDWQGRGLGEMLLRALVSAAARAGVPTLSSLTLANNYAMRELARKVGFGVHRDPHDATVVQLRLPLPVDAPAEPRYPALQAGLAARFPESATLLDWTLNALLVAGPIVMILVSVLLTAVPPA